MNCSISRILICTFAAATAFSGSAVLTGCDQVASLFRSGKNPKNVAELCDGKHTGRHAAYQNVIDEACRKLKDAESSNDKLRKKSESLGNTGEILSAEVESVREKSEKRIAEKDAKIKELNVQIRELTVKLSETEKRLNTESSKAACVYRKGVSGDEFIKNCLSLDPDDMFVASAIRDAKRNKDCGFVLKVYEKQAEKSAVWAKLLGREYDPKYSQNSCIKADKKKADSWYSRAK